MDEAQYAFEDVDDALGAGVDHSRLFKLGEELGRPREGGIGFLEGFRHEDDEVIGPLREAVRRLGPVLQDGEYGALAGGGEGSVGVARGDDERLAETPRAYAAPRSGPSRRPP
jgi:hypothetical protein